MWNLRLTVAVLVLGGILSCADEKAVNAAFFQSRVSWYVFDAASATGVQSITGFEQPLKVVWKPASEAVFASDLAPSEGGLGAAAVSGLGLLILDDSTGLLQVQRPKSEPALTAYRTSRLFRWNKKTFLGLYREMTASAEDGNDPEAVTLAWWAEGNPRLTFYPLISQTRDKTRQAIGLDPELVNAKPATIDLHWRFLSDQGWQSADTRLDLATGNEQSVTLTEMDKPVPPSLELDPLVQRLTARLGGEVSTFSATEGGHLLLATREGWVAVGQKGSSESRLYRLPEIGTAGEYTHAVALTHGFVLTWNTRWRGYAGAAGLVYVPYGVLAP